MTKDTRHTMHERPPTQIGPDEAPYTTTTRSLLESGEVFAEAQLEDGTYVRKGDQFWDTEECAMLTVTDVVERDSDVFETEVYVLLESDDPSLTEGRAPGESMPVGNQFREEESQFLDDLHSSRYQAHTGNGYLDPNMRI